MGSTFDANLAYSPAEHFFINAGLGRASSVSRKTNDSISPTMETKFRNFQYHLSLGCFDTIISDHLRIQAAIGYGVGESGGVRLTVDPAVILLFPFAYADNGIYGASYENLFGQFSLHQATKNQLLFGLLYKLNYLNIDAINYFNKNGNTADFSLRSRAQWVHQVAIEFIKERKNIGTFFQLQFAFAEPYSKIVTVRNTGFHFGLYLKLNELFAKPSWKEKRKSSKPFYDERYRSHW